MKSCCRSRPCGSSVSYQPPTSITAGLMFFRYFQMARDCQTSSYVVWSNSDSKRLLVLEVLLVGIGQRAHLQKEAVAVGRAELEGQGRLRRLRVAFTRRGSPYRN